MNIEQAQSLVQAELDKNTHLNDDDQCVILEEETIEKEWGWVFFYQSKKYIESGDIEDMLAGNAPYIVNKRNGQLHETGTAEDIEHYIQEFEQNSL
jgi:hypothetical protein